VLKLTDAPCGRPEAERVTVSGLLPTLDTVSVVQSPPPGKTVVLVGLTERVKAWMKFAVWVIGAFKVTVAGFAFPLYEPMPEPIQLSKAYPVAG
jgi:hypothetical protein